MKVKAVIEKSAHGIFLLCATISILAVCSITGYMILKGTPAFSKVGIFDMILSGEWKPTADNPSYGIAYIILSSIVGTTTAI